MLRISIIFLITLLNCLYSGTFNFKEFPSEKWFFPRSSKNNFIFNISGCYTGEITNLDTISIVLSEQENVISMQKEELKKIFLFNIEIPSKLFAYNCSFYLNDSLIKRAENLTCGDVIIVYGQSNAHGGNAPPSLFIKSFGYKDSSHTDSVNAALCEQDTTFKTHSGGCANLGASWETLVLELQKTEQIPFCIINGALGGRRIDLFLPDTLNRMNLLTSYGRLLYRIKKSGLQNAVNVIIWHQGESDANIWFGPKYNDSFDRLYKGWKSDFPNLQKIYLYQIGLGCGSTNFSSQFREIQRKIPQRYKDIQIMNTVGYINHSETDKCHYDYHGYQQLGKWLVNAYNHDIYHNEYNLGIYPPNILNAFFTSETKKQVAIEFDQEIIIPAKNSPDKIENYFYFGTDSFIVKSLSVHENGFTLLLDLYKVPETDSVSYLPQKFYNRSNVVFEGPWLTNINGLGALSFFDFCINDTGTVKNLTSISKSVLQNIENKEIYVYPNPTNATTKISFKLNESEFYSLKIYDELGRVKIIFMHKYFNKGHSDISLDLNDYSSGIYFLWLKSERKNKKLIFKKIVLAK